MHKIKIIAIPWSCGCRSSVGCGACCPLWVEGCLEPFIGWLGVPKSGHWDIPPGANLILNFPVRRTTRSWCWTTVVWVQLHNFLNYYVTQVLNPYLPKTTVITETKSFTACLFSLSASNKQKITLTLGITRLHKAGFLFTSFCQTQGWSKPKNFLDSRIFVC